MHGASRSIEAAPPPQARANGAARPSKSDPPPDSEAPGPGAHVYKMKDLCDKAGVSRQLVHFYIQQGLLPEGKKTGKNMAYYGEHHVERLLLVRKLQDTEHFLPPQGHPRRPRAAGRGLLSRAAKAHARRPLGALRGCGGARGAAADGGRARALLGDSASPARTSTRWWRRGSSPWRRSRRDLETGRRREVIASDDASLLEHYAELRAAGLTPERGFHARDLAIYDEAVHKLVTRETRLLSSRIGGLPAAQAAVLLEKALPIVGSLLSRLHAARAKNFFATL